MGLLKSFIFFFSFPPLLSLAQKKNEKEVRLVVGEFKTLDFISSTKVNLSRRGIVVLSYVKEGQWKIVAHRKGFVVLNYEEKISKEKKQVLIYVEAEKQERKRGDVAWVCEKKFIKCSYKPLIVSGVTDSWFLLYSLKRWCKRKSECSLALRLSLLGQRKLKQELQGLLKNLSNYKVGPFGIETLSLSCPSQDNKFTMKKKLIKDLLEQAYLTPIPPIVCKHEYKPSQYKVFAKVYLMTDSRGEYFGGKTVGVSDFFKKGAESTLLTKLESLEKNHELKIIGEPKIIVKEGVQGFSKTGGEFSFAQNSSGLDYRQKSIVWKNYGLSLKAAVYSESKAKGNLLYHLTLSVPSSSRSHTSVKAVEFSGVVKVNFGQKIIAGTTQYDSYKKLLEKDSFFSKVPIISIFFSRKTKEKSSSYLVLSLEVKEFSL